MAGETRRKQLRLAACCLFALCLLIACYGLVQSEVLAIALDNATDATLALHPVPSLPSRRAAEKETETSGDGREDLFWLIHVSDLHISRYVPKRTEKLRTFAGQVVPAVAPEVVLVTGDLVDSKYPDLVRSQQFLDEWMTYRTILQEYDLWQPDLWVDVRGNHDCFGVGGDWTFAGNHFRDFSVTGAHFDQPVRELDFSFPEKEGTRNEAALPSRALRVVTLDACPLIGAFTPLNFFGRMSREQVDRVEQQLAKRQAEGTVTLVMGHYPLSTILSDRSSSGKTIQEVVEESTAIAYLCGHLHTMFDATPRLHARHRPGGRQTHLLELEVGDFKSSSRFRIIAFDHGVMATADLTVGQWPAVVVTNPKDAAYLSSMEPHGQAAASSAIRFLAFSTERVTEVRAVVDGRQVCHEVGLNRDTYEDPLFSCPWNTAELLHGLHELEVEVADALGRRTTHRHRFSLDGTTTTLDLLPKFVLCSDMPTVLHTLYWGIVAGMLGLAAGIAGYAPSSLRGFRLPLVLWLWGGPLVLPWFLGMFSKAGDWGAMWTWAILYLGTGQGDTFGRPHWYATLDTYLLAGKHLLLNSGISLFLCLDGACSWREEGGRRQAVADVLLIAYGLWLVRCSIGAITFIYKAYDIVAVVVSPMIGWLNFAFVGYGLCLCIGRTMRLVRRTKEKERSD